MLIARSCQHGRDPDRHDLVCAPGRAGKSTVQTIDALKADVSIPGREVKSNKSETPASTRGPQKLKPMPPKPTLAYQLPKRAGIQSSINLAVKPVEKTPTPSVSQKVTAVPQPRLPVPA